MQSDHARIAAKGGQPLWPFLGAIYQRKASRAPACHDDPGQAPKLPWFLHAGPILVVRRSGQTAQRCRSVCVWPASRAQPLLPLLILVLLLQGPGRTDPNRTRMLGSVK